ncbi:Uncharacterized protein TCM_024764 [Theobroma cacao]|uniref:Reverse transcriptase Ty1/copia-type domain-containing protein n=1 Tax=Theobroma cacao TaxID=3641 RepID=A0A061EXF0_THECC|nr:Uncharacterized protein TCM_024764 [Theobroma cacao]
MVNGFVYYSISRKISKSALLLYYEVAMNADDTVQRYKARLVAKRYNQVEGFDYQETFSPVAKQTAVRVFMALATAK